MDKFQLTGDRKKIFRALDCYEESPFYEEMLEVYEEMLEQAKRVVTPKAALYIEENLSEQEVEEFHGYKEIIYNCLTVGEALPKMILQKFEKGDYLEGMVLDSIADCFTFEVFDQVYEQLYGYLKDNQLGTIRLSPGERGFDIRYHKLLKQKLQTLETIGVDINESYMLNPVKSTSSVFVADKGLVLNKKLHECKKCADSTCKWRQKPYED
ncbi:MAG: hypothetical protein ACRC1P_10485 [Cellulosilyticaceae bacterium]